jgi:predicted nucleic acid-binding protein
MNLKEGSNMPSPSLILDTCAFHDRRFITWLSGYNGRLAIPPTVYMERCRQLLDKEEPLDDFNEMLDNLRIKVLDFKKNNAAIAAELMAGRNKICRLCGKLDWVDTMIASHCYDGDYIVSNNKRDFPTIFEDRILTIAQSMNRL